MEKKKCTSCKHAVTNDRKSTNFTCPVCGKEQIIRCGHCRATAITYKCKCGFEGP